MPVTRSRLVSALGRTFESRAFRPLAALIISAVALAASSCRDDLTDQLEPTKCPDQAVFQSAVSPYLERRCGTLDCHGASARPLRLYGRYGLRFHAQTGSPVTPACVDEAPNVPGGVATTPCELEANYFSVCNVDSAKMDEIAQNANIADESLLITKARATEKHKGGKVVNEADDPGNDCLLGWLAGGDAAKVEQACAEAIDRLE